MKKLKDLINVNYPKLLECKNFIYDKKALLCALAQVESSFGRHNVPRFESHYYRGGHYYRKSQEIRDMVSLYDKDASCSYSSFQIMFPTARELGYRGVPTDLNKDNVAIYWVIKFINIRIMKKEPRKLEDIFDAYNSGNFKDDIIPVDYIKKAVGWYNFYVEENKKEILETMKEYKAEINYVEDIIKFKDSQKIEYKKLNWFKKFINFWRNR
jgi:hypothetical protein